MENNQANQMKYSVKPYLLNRHILFTLFMLLLASSCSYRRSLPLNGPLNLDTEKVQAGQVLYAQYCQKCHPQGEGGLGPAMNHIPAPPKRLQIRHGFGAMPAFKKDQISKPELDQLMAYLKALRQNRD
jgi:mono/diheme cytochrome c family protein